nr:12695_t:CDS:2 [Entrophospora candida]
MTVLISTPLPIPRPKAAKSVLSTGELLYIIFSEFVHQDDLFSCLLINRLWAMTIARVLWKEPCWKTYESYRKWLKTLKLPHTTLDYAILVQRLSFKPHKRCQREKFTVSELKSIVSKCQNVKHLEFYCLQGTFDPTNVAMFLKTLPNLLSFKTDASWQPALDSILVNMAEGFCPKLTQLEIPGNGESDRCVTLLKQIGEKCPKIVKLKTRWEIRSAKLASVIVGSFSNLESLICRGINYDGLRILLPGCRKLKSMEFTFTMELNDEMVLSVAQIFPQLEYLNLKIFGRNNFPQFMSSWAPNQINLREIYLSVSEGLTDESFIPITQYCHSLETVTLWWCGGFTELSFEALARNRNIGLKHLYFYHVKEMTDVGLEAIADYCPQLQDLHLVHCESLTQVSLLRVARNCKNLVSFNAEFCSKRYYWQWTAGFLFTLANRNRGSLEELKYHDRNTCIIDSEILENKFRFDGNLFERLALRCPKLKVLELFTYHQETNPNVLFRSLSKFQNLESLVIYPGEEAKRQHFEKLLSHRRLKQIVLYYGNNVDIKSFYDEHVKKNKGVIYTEFWTGRFIVMGAD